VIGTKRDQNLGTPKWLFHWLAGQYDFSLDAAASYRNRLCEHYFNEKTNGLKQAWWTWTFCNPPFKDCDLWVAKAMTEQAIGNYSVLLLPALGMSSRWYATAHDLCWTRLVAPRVAFIGSGKAPNGMIMLCEFGRPNPTRGLVEWVDLRGEHGVAA
jgi:phage N-6-adenine-methyltransferase